ncbi:MAG: hypothetical protein HW387_1601 [Parachlamydiales bacterium]|nr:hypothetical protein [Parachlamydiales bacterium]
MSDDPKHFGELPLIRRNAWFSAKIHACHCCIANQMAHVELLLERRSSSKNSALRAAFSYGLHHSDRLRFHLALPRLPLETELVGNDQGQVSSWRMN